MKLINIFFRKGIPYFLLLAMIVLLLMGFDVLPVKKHLLFCVFIFIGTAFIGFQEQQKYFKEGR